MAVPASAAAPGGRGVWAGAGGRLRLGLRLDHGHELPTRPPLRARPRDVALLLRHYLDLFCNENRRRRLNLDSAFWRDRLQQLNRDQVIFERLEWRIVHNAMDAARRYLETVVLPAIEEAEKVRGGGLVP